MSWQRSDEDAVASAFRPASSLLPMVSSASAAFLPFRPFRFYGGTSPNVQLCNCRRDHLISSAVSRDDSPPSLSRDPLTVRHHVGHRLRRFNAERASHKAGSLTSSRRGPNTALPPQGSHRAAAERDESAEFLEPDLWQLEEPLGASPGLGSLDSQDDGVDAFWGAASSYSNPFEEQDGDPALAERRLRSLSGSPSTSGRSSAAFKGKHTSELSFSAHSD